ncbi:MAG TPA: YbaN family protein [Bacillota bacterium]|nr:YbaN family protein [Bacillota bacterium]
MTTGLKKTLLMTLGVVSVALGLLGVFIPLLPTTPFLLLAAWSFLRSSKRLHQWLMNHRICGEYIYNYTKYRSVRRSTKNIAIITLWLSMAVSMYLVQRLHVTFILVAIGLMVTLHIASLKTFENLPASDQERARQRCMAVRETK